jgi:hypothetical protein
LLAYRVGYALKHFVENATMAIGRSGFKQLVDLFLELLIDLLGNTG